MPETQHRIDVHHHIMPPEYISALSSVNINTSAKVQFPKWDVDRSLAFMERQNIAAAVLSISAPGIHFGDNEFAQKLARKCNVFSAGIISKHPERIGAFAVLPIPDMNTSLSELEYSLDTLGLDGVGLLSNYHGKFLGDPIFVDLFSELNRRKTVVFVHPNTLPEEMLPKTKVSPAIMEFVFDTTRVIANLIYSRTLRKFPEIQFIFPHAGGTVPYLAYRISMGQKSVIKQLKRLYYDIALSATPYALSSLQTLVDSSHILFGSDFPFFPEPLFNEMITEYSNYEGLDAEMRKSIDRDNALSLFPRFKNLI